MMLRRICALLLFISCITFHTNVSADIKEKEAEKYRALGYAEQQKGKLDQALTHYIKAVTMGAENAALLNDMGVLYEEIDLNNKAVHYYTESIRKDPNYLPAYINIAFLYQRLGRTEEAAYYFRQRYEMGDPSDPWAQKAKEELIKIKPEYQSWVRAREAETLSKEIVSQSKDEFYRQIERSQQHYLKGEKLYRDGHFNEAIREYNIAFQLAPNNPKIVEARKDVIIEITKERMQERSDMAIQMMEAGDTASARFEVEKMLKLIPREPLLRAR